MGGFVNNKRSNSGYLINIRDNVWSILPSSPLSPTANSRAVSLDNDRVFIWGG